MARTYRATDKAVAVAIDPATLLGADIGAVTGQSGVGFQRSRFAGQSALDGLGGVQIPGMVEVEFRQLLRHQCRIGQAGKTVL